MKIKQLEARIARHITVSSDPSESGRLLRIKGTHEVINALCDKLDGQQVETEKASAMIGHLIDEPGQSSLTSEAMTAQNKVAEQFAAMPPGRERSEFFRKHRSQIL